MTRPVVVIDCVGLTPAHLGSDTPRLSRLAQEGCSPPMDGVVPAVTTTAQTTLVTGVLPQEHGIVRSPKKLAAPIAVITMTGFSIAREGIRKQSAAEPSPTNPRMRRVRSTVPDHRWSRGMTMLEARLPKAPQKRGTEEAVVRRRIRSVMPGSKSTGWENSNPAQPRSDDAAGPSAPVAIR